MRRHQRLALLLGFILVVSACAGKPPARVDATTELPKELSSDLQTRFEVKEVAPSPSPSPSPSVEPSPEPTPHHHKKKHHKKAPEAEPSPSPSPTVAFEYPNRRPVNEPIWVGESLTYDVKYFGLRAGEFTLTVMPFKSVDNRKVYHIQGTAKTEALFSAFYKLDDMAETFIDYEGFFSHRFHILLNETKQTRDALELYDSEKAQTFYWNRWNRRDAGYTESKDFKPIVPFVQDTLSSVYYLRSVPLPPGAVIEFPVASEGKVVQTIVTVIRREEIDTPMGKKMAIVVKPEAKAATGVMTKKGDSYMWLTDDDRRILVRLEAKVKVGTIVAELKKVDLGTPPAQ
jgi:hypothetical protein